MKNRLTLSDLLFLIIILFLLVATFISYHRIIKLNDDSDLLALSTRVKYKLAAALAFFRETENRQQHSIQDNDKKFNPQLEKDSALTFQKLHELDSLIHGDKTQQIVIGQLDKTLHKLFENLKAEHVKAEKLSEDLSFYSLQSQTILNKIQQLIVELRHKEDDLLLQKIQQKDRSAFFTPVYSMFLSFLAISIVTVAYFRLRKENFLRNEMSELVQARNQLQEAENRSRLAIEAARMGTFDWDLKNQHFLSSERLVEIFGFHNALHVTHQDLIDCFHPDDKPIRDKAVNNSFLVGSLKYEARLIWKDKSIHWINVYGKILADETRNILRMYGTVVDITPQKIALEEIKESESKFRLLADAMPQQIWTAEKFGRLNYCNQAVIDYSGLNFKDIQKKGWLSIIHPDDQENTMRKWTESIEKGHEFIFEHRFRNFNGDYRWQLSRAIAQKDKSGNIQSWIGTSTDIHDQKHFMQELEKKVFERTQSLNYANLALKQSVNALEQTNSELASFNYIASHDLQEPLRKIIAFSKRIGDLDQKNLSDSSRDYFSRIIQATYRMQNLIDAFLSYSQTNNIRAVFEPTDFNQVFREVKNDFSEIIELRNIILESQPLPVLMGIPIQINQLFTNLIGNAIKYGRRGIDPKIEVLAEEMAGSDLAFEDADPENGFWKISIRDNGIGFDPIYENQIFELFQRLHSRQEYAGTGIGLAICKKIMRNHKGFISASGETGSGAVFSMYFPAISER